MPATTTEPAADPGAAAAPVPPRWQRLAWFVGLWLAGVAAVGAVAFLFRLAMKAAG
jgi:hypothetical protein